VQDAKLIVSAGVRARVVAGLRVLPVAMILGAKTVLELSNVALKALAMEVASDKLLLETAE
jgi:hypothetical protein